ncbi:MAG: aldehyde dehydrogenase family protein, partial [Patescibacteria group bacterium]
MFDDADVDLVTRSVGEFRLSNCGQYCDGLKRLIVEEKVFNEVVERISASFATRKIGPAHEETTQLGPLAAKRQHNLLVEQVSDAVRKGARIMTGGHSLEKQLGGSFYEPTVLANVNPDMRVWKEEVFGPVLPVVSFRTEEEAIALANDTTYGLGSYIYTADLKRADRVADAIQSG